MPRIGIDCDITLTHASVNNGNPYGFILKPQQGQQRGSVTVQRQPHEEVRLSATLVFADQLTNPNGSRHAATRNQMYEMYQLFVAQHSAITLETDAGAIANLVPPLLISTEKITADTVEAALNLTATPITAATSDVSIRYQTSGVEIAAFIVKRTQQRLHIALTLRRGFLGAAEGVYTTIVFTALAGNNLVKPNGEVSATTRNQWAELAYTVQAVNVPVKVYTAWLTASIPYLQNMRLSRSIKIAIGDNDTVPDEMEFGLEGWEPY